MTITTQRVIFERPRVAFLFSLFWQAFSLFVERRGIAPQHAHSYEVPLDSITSIWKWRPEYSGPPFIQCGTSDGWHFALVKEGRVHPEFAGIQNVRAHCETLEHAWKETRQTAPIEAQ